MKFKGQTMDFDPNTYDNRGFSDLDARHDFEEYMQTAVDKGGAWDYLNPEHARDAMMEYDYKALKVDMGLFMALYDKGQYRQASDIIHAIVTRYCDAGARQDYIQPETDYGD
jgi:hypothetical protein